jgi:hypothetical protein
MKHLVGRIQASNYLYFIKDELDPDGTNHNKLLYIMIRCKDILIGKVLIVNGLTLNVFPRHLLDESYMRPRTITTRVYDGSPR